MLERPDRFSEPNLQPPSRRRRGLPNVRTRPITSLNEKGAELPTETPSQYFEAPTREPGPKPKPVTPLNVNTES